MLVLAGEAGFKPAPQKDFFSGLAGFFHDFLE
jgi:hypothetical protein